MTLRREFDVPRRRSLAPLLWVLAILAVIVGLAVAAGLVGGVGPLRILGVREQDLAPIAWRATGDPALIQVAVALPPAGLCSGDEIYATAFERGPRLEIGAVLAEPRNRAVCSGIGIAGDRVWVDLRLDDASRGLAFVSVVDKSPLLEEPPPRT